MRQEDVKDKRSKAEMAAEQVSKEYFRRLREGKRLTANDVDKRMKYHMTDGHTRLVDINKPQTE